MEALYERGSSSRRAYAATLAIWFGAASLVQAEAVPLTTSRGRCDFVLKASAGEQYHLIVGSLAPANTKSRITIRTTQSSGPTDLPLEKTREDPAWRKRIQEQAALLERARRQRPALDAFTPLAQPPRSKVFHLFVGERDLENPARYQAVPADLHSLGTYCQVYVDREDRDLPGLAATAADLRRVFDNDVSPWAARRLGKVVDVDRDGRFTLFLTRRLEKMHKGKSPVEGFVRGSDFLRDLAPPFSNQCDMLYLSASLAPGRHLRTVLAHEYTHAVAFCEHALAGYGGAGPTRQDEESWLSEGLAHLVEHLHGFSRSNLDYRIKDYLARPDSYPLVVPDYFSAGLWRTPGQRGGAFLFLKHCYETSDPDLLRRLIQSPLNGIDNLEVAAQTPFPQLFRDFCVSLLHPKDDASTPRLHALPLENGGRDIVLPGTSAAFFFLHFSAADHVRVEIASEPDIDLQVTLVPQAAKFAH